jgi:hypothetical protein
MTTSRTKEFPHMANEAPGGLVDGTIDPKDMPGLGAERSTEEVVRDIISKDPAAHGVTLEERNRRAIEEAKRLEAENKAFFGDSDDPL